MARKNSFVATTICHIMLWNRIYGHHGVKLRFGQIWHGAAKFFSTSGGFAHSSWYSCKKLGPVLRQVYEQMAEPRWVIAMGACASSGGVFDTYSVLQGIDKVIPVDVYIPGCPPRPEQLIEGIIKIQELVQSEGIDRRSKPEYQAKIAQYNLQ